MDELQSYDKTKYNMYINLPTKFIIIALTLFILIDHSIHMDTTHMELSIPYDKGLLVNISIKLCTSVPEDHLFSSKQSRP